MTLNYLVETWGFIAKREIKKGNDRKAQKAYNILQYIHENYVELAKYDGMISNKTCPTLFDMIRAEYQ